MRTNTYTGCQLNGGVMSIIQILLMLGFLSGENDSTVVKDQKPSAKGSLFVVLYTPGAGWDASKPPNEQKHFVSHSKRLGALRKEQRIKIGARYSDKGMLILQAVSLEEAQGIVSSDSAVIDGTFTAEIHPMMVFYQGCVE